MTTFIAGSTGHFGSVLSRVFLSHGIKVRTLIRKESLDKPIVAELKKLGAEIIVGDVTDKDSLAIALKGVDHVVSALAMPDHELLLLAAAQEAKVKLYIPSLWSGPSDLLTKEQLLVKEVRERNLKAVTESGLNYVIIYHGAWLDNLTFLGFDYKSGTFELAGDHKISLIHTKDVAEYTYRLVNDSSLWNHEYFIESERTSLKDLNAVFEQHGKKFQVVPLSEEDLNKKLATLSNPFNFFGVITYQLRWIVSYSDLFVQRDVANHKLFPDYKPKSSEEYIVDFLAGKDINQFPY